MIRDRCVESGFGWLDSLEGEGERICNAVRSDTRSDGASRRLVVVTIGDRRPIKSERVVGSLFELLVARMESDKVPSMLFAEMESAFAMVETGLAFLSDADSSSHAVLIS